MKERGFGPVEWYIYAHPLFSTFLRCLSEVQGSTIRKYPSNSFALIDDD